MNHKLPIRLMRAMSGPLVARRSPGGGHGPAFIYKSRLPQVAIVLLLAWVLAIGVDTASPASAQQTQQRGIFGTITSLQPMGTGLTVLTVEAVDGTAQEIEVLDELTIVEIPGRHSAAAADLSVGDFVAALILDSLTAININTASAELLGTLTQIGSVRAQAIIDYRESQGPFSSINEILDVPGIGPTIFNGIRLQIVVDDHVEAQWVMVKPPKAVLSSHFTGVVLKRDLDLDQMTLMDRDGNRVVFNIPASATLPFPGDVVTATVKHDPKLDTSTVLGLDLAEAAQGRLRQALDLAELQGASINLENLKQRLKNATTGSLTLLRNVADRTPPATVPLARAVDDVERVLEEFGLGSPLLITSGVVDLVDPEAGVMGVTPDIGSPVELFVDAFTTITEEGSSVSLHEELFGRRVKATYDLVSFRAIAIEILASKVLAEELTRALIPLALVGEVEGTVSALELSFTPPSMLVQPAEGDPIRLTVPDGTSISLEGVAARLEDILRAQVKVRYDTALGEALQIESASRRPSETFLSGVVTSLIRKETRRVTVASSTGPTLTLTITEDTFIERDGQLVPINEIRLGDLVRPTTRYNATSLELGKLALKSPITPVTGPIRGIDTNPEKGRLTVSDPSLGLVTFIVTGATEIIRLGEESDLASIRLGERLDTRSVFNAATHEALRLVVEPAIAAQASGVISTLNSDLFIITVTQTDGEVIPLLVPNKPGIITLDNDPRANFLQLSIGDLVPEVFYRRDDLVVFTLVVTSP